MEEKEMLTVAAIVLGAIILAGGMYYLVKGRADAEERRIYLVTALVGAVILAAAVIKAFVWGF